VLRHSVRQLVKLGEFTAFVGAARELNAALSKAGMPTYSYWLTVYGDQNEVWAEAEYESLDMHVQLWDNARANEEVMTAFRALLNHLVPGSTHDYPLQPLTFG
jgi:hypothetical protein